jgi:uncharacterized protein YodC (DUF2158 family)
LEQKYKAGDIVQLRSGGPKMTVQRYGESNIESEGVCVWCKWFVGSKYKHESFLEDSLEPAEDDESKS